MSSIYDEGKEAFFTEGFGNVATQFGIYDNQEIVVGDLESIDGPQSFVDDVRGSSAAGWKFDQEFQILFDGTFENTTLTGITFRGGGNRLLDIDFSPSSITVPSVGSYIAYNPNNDNFSTLINITGNITENGALSMSTGNGIQNDAVKIVAVSQVAVGETNLNSSDWFYNNGELRYVEPFEIEIDTGSSEDIEELRLENSNGNILWRFPISTINVPSAGGFITYNPEDPSHDVRLGLEEE